MPPRKPVIKWYGPQVSAKVNRKAYEGLRRATAFAQRKVKEAISKPAMVGKGGAKSPSAKSKRKPRRYQHSKPGQPPRAITGKLRQSIFQSTDRKRMLGSVGTTLKYGAALEKGVRAHEIRATRKKALVFPGWVGKAAEYTKTGKVRKGKGERSEWGWVFRKRVRHPGIARRPYLFKTIGKHRARIRQILLGRVRALFAGGRVTFGGG